MTPKSLSSMRKSAPLASFAEILEPHEAQEPILAKPVRDALMEWLTEIWAADELAAAGLAPRRRALFDGPPGTGKTTLAHHLAARLGLPLACVRPERIVAPWLGESEQNVGAMFDAAKAEGPVVLFLDEFDTLAASREGGPDRGGAQNARNNVVNVILQRMDAHDGYIIAATNRGGVIDPAVWRRFDIQIRVDLPGKGERMRIVERYLAPYRLSTDALDALADDLNTASPALIRALCDGIKRQLIVGPKVGWDMARDAVFARLCAAIEPHPEIGKPRLWSAGAKAPSLAKISWPLEMGKAA